jgi:hypothetical protein
LTTPPNGIEDLYGSVTYSRKDIGPLASIAATFAYHRFAAEHIAMHYGNEANWQVQAKWRAFLFTFKYADYRADRLLTDTQKLWLQIEYAL